ncbi:MAG: TonB-dependent receptor, partial [Verrucomicrobia bacterium]|nr:TonB-dependent receptor [Verrucomicrobiota bacterium]
EWSASGAVEWSFLEDWEMQWMHQYLDDRFTQGIRFDEPLREVDGSYVSSLHLHYEPAFLRDYEGRISLHMENLFNSGYAYRPGYPMPGRNFRLALQFSL